MEFFFRIGLVTLVALGCGRTELWEDVDRGPSFRNPAPAPVAIVVDAGRADAGHPDAGADAGTRCASLGGVCVLGKWASCPVGRQPAEDLHADCPRPSGRGDFCCVPAPSSPCVNAGGLIDCFPTAGCHTCWDGFDGGLSCASGRTCCGYACLD